MSTSADALKIIQSLVKRTRNARVTFPSLVTYAEKYLARAADEDSSLEDFADNPSNLMTAYLMDLEKQKRVELTYVNGMISAVKYPEYYSAIVRTAHERLDNQIDRPFPAEDSIPVDIPAELIEVVDIKLDFTRHIVRAENRESAGLLRLMFPDGIHSMLVTTDLVASLLPKLCVHKFRHYLRVERNAGYMRSKLASIFRQREVAMKDMLSSILTTPDQALRTVWKPTDFTFHFWTQLSSTIIKEYSQKKDKLPEEHGFCQAAYLLGYYNVHFRGVQQRSLERETALRQLENSLRKPPYIFSISQIHQFTDSRGVALTKKYSLDDVNRYVQERIEPGDDASLPAMIRVKSSDGSEHYVYRDFVPHVTIEHVFALRKEFRDSYLESWSESLKRNHRPAEMSDDVAFERSVAERLKETDPLLEALLNYSLLFLTRQEGNVAPDLAFEIDELLDTKEARLRPLPVVFNLDRKRLYSDARLLLPFWQAIPILAAFVALLKRIFLGAADEERLQRDRRRQTRTSRRRGTPDESGSGVTAPASTTVRYSPDGASGNGLHDAPDATAGSSSAAGRRAQLSRFKDAVRTLQKEFVPPGSTPERTLVELADRWNPLLDPIAKQNLVEDVNSLARDFLRRMKVSFRLVPPTRERVQEWSDRLCRAEAFSQIRRRDDLKQYIKLYMLLILGK